MLKYIVLYKKNNNNCLLIITIINNDPISYLDLKKGKQIYIMLKFFVEFMILFHISFWNLINL